MLNDAEEAADMLRSGTGALLVNLGTVTREQGAAMQTAVREANRLNIPWVLDPVAVGALSLRTRLAGQLKEQSPASSAETLLKSWPWPAIPPSRKGRKAPAPAQTPCMRPGTGPAHRGGRARYRAYGLFHGRPPGNRHGKRTRHDVPGHGRGLFHGSTVRRLCRRLPHPLQAAVSTAVLMGIAGEMAFEQSPFPGSFAVSLLDSLYALSPEDVVRRARFLSL